MRPLAFPPCASVPCKPFTRLRSHPSWNSGDKNSYGFREGRRCADALQQCHLLVAKGYAPAWVLEGDIKACFDEISHNWILQHVPMDKQILKQWLKAGYLEKGRLFPTTAGTPQGELFPPSWRI